MSLMNGGVHTANNRLLKLMNMEQHQLSNQKAGAPLPGAAVSNKRTIRDTMDDDDEEMGDSVMDMERFEDRPSFVPFIEGEIDPSMDFL